MTFFMLFGPSITIDNQSSYKLCARQLLWKAIVCHKPIAAFKIIKSLNWQPIEFKITINLQFQRLFVMLQRAHELRSEKKYTKQGRKRDREGEESAMLKCKFIWGSSQVVNFIFTSVVRPIVLRIAIARAFNMMWSFEVDIKFFSSLVLIQSRNTQR